MNISIDYEKVAASRSRKQFLKRLIITTAIVTNLLPLFTRDILNNNAKLVLATAGFISALACCKLPDYSHEEKLEKTYRETSLKQYKILLQGEILKTQTNLEITNQQELAATIERVPEHQIDYFANKYGVSPLLAKYYIDGEYEADEEKQAIEPIEKPLQPTIYMPQSATSEWIDTIVYEFTQSQGKRIHEHLMINGGTQSGKSTLISAILGKVINAYKHQGRHTFINLIDPKYPMTRWLFEPSFKGFEEVSEGISQAIKELEVRKHEAKQAKQEKRNIPEFHPYLCVIDEWDICYGNGKGYGGLIGKDEAIQNLASVKRIIAEGAAYDVRVIVIGQSPLSGDNGLNRTIAKQTTRIVVGQEGLSWLQDPGFPFKKDAPSLIDEIEPLIKAEKRVALICPNKGRVKVFEIPKIDILMPQDSQQASQPENQPEAKTTISDSKPTLEQILDAMAQWAIATDGITTDSVIAKWQEVTGKDLNDKGQLELINQLKARGVQL